MLKIERLGSFEIWKIEEPRTKNALDYATLTALTQRVHALMDDRNVRALILTATGDTFVSGGDLRELRDTDTPEEVRIFTDLGYELSQRMEELGAPVICAMPGAAIGGGAELALGCDLRILDQQGFMAFRQVRMGVTTAWGSTEKLIALCGPSTAARLLYLGDDVSANDALAMGLVDAVAAPGNALSMALEWAEKIALAGPEAIAQMKALLVHTRRTPVRARELEREKFIGTWMSSEHREAMAAFFQNRQPVWTK